MTETRKLLSIFTGITFVAFLAFQTVSMTNVSASDVCPGGDNSWNSNWYKDEHSSFGVTASGYIIDQICVKGGQNMVTFNSNGSNGCWSVSGIGTQTGSAVKVGQGSSCKDISHASFHRVVIVSPTPSSVPSSTPTVTPSPTAVPTAVPTAIPTAVPTTIPSVTPVVSVAVEPSVTPSVSPDPTITTTPTVTPTDTPSSSTNNNNSSNNNSSSNNEVKVAGISALASTGGIIDSLMNSIFVSGLLTFAFGLKRHGKKS